MSARNATNPPTDSQANEGCLSSALLAVDEFFRHTNDDMPEGCEAIIADSLRRRPITLRTDREAAIYVAGFFASAGDILESGQLSTISFSANSEVDHK